VPSSHNETDKDHQSRRDSETADFPAIPAGSQQLTGTTGPPCGNNPHFSVSRGDQQVVDGFKAYLQRRRAGGPPERDPWTQAPPPRPQQETEA
jgi:hypothetical protein